MCKSTGTTPYISAFLLLFPNNSTKKHYKMTGELGGYDALGARKSVRGYLDTPVDYPPGGA